MSAETFSYKGISAGKYVEGTVEALSQEEASFKLKVQKIIITRLVRAKKKAAEKKKGSGGGLTLFKKKIKPEDVVIFSKQFATMVKAGLPILNVLTMLRDQLEHPELKIIVEDKYVVKPVEVATTIITLIERLHPREFQWAPHGYLDKLYGSNQLRLFVAQKKPPSYLSPQYIHDEAWGIKATNDGGCVTIAGTGDEYNYSQCNGNDCSDTWNAYLIKFDNIGNIDFETTFSSLDLYNYAYDWAGEDIDLTDDGGAVIAVDNGQFGFLKIDGIQTNLIGDINFDSMIDILDVVILVNVVLGLEQNNVCLLYTSPSPRDS